MLKQMLPVAALAAIAVGAASCKGGGFKKTKDGVEYNIVHDEKNGPNAKMGDFLEYNMMVRIGDSLLFDSHKMLGKAVEMQLMENPNANKASDPTEVILMMSAGDSVVIRVALDSQTRKMYSFAKPEDKLQYEFKLISIKSKADYEAGLKKQQEEMMAKAGEQASADDKTISEYLTANKMSAQKTAGGVYYVVTKPGSGANAAAGQTVSVKYTGKTMDGKAFDSNIDPQFGHAEPFEFTVGQGQVIRGWDEAFMSLNKGAKATILIPSGLAYGPQGREPQIPANAILMFDVELVNIK